MTSAMSTQVKSVYFLLVFVSTAMSYKTRLNLIESRLGTLEIRVNIENREIRSAVDTINTELRVLNSSISDVEERVCYTRDLDIIKHENSQEDNKGSEFFGIKNEAMIRNRVLKGFIEQKAWLHKSLNEITDIMNDYQNRSTAIADDVREYIYLKFEDIERERNVQGSRVKLLEKEVNELRSREDEHAKVLEGFQETVKDLKSNATVITQENEDLIAALAEKDKMIENINLEIYKLKEDIRDLRETTQLKSRSSTTAPNSTMSPTLTTTKKKDFCPEGWYQFACYCYLFEDDTMSFTAARTFCISKGAHMVDIESKKENDFVTKISREIFTNGKHAWLGLTDEEKEGQWIWERTGKIASYTNWRPGQPNNLFGEQHYALIGENSPYEQWDDAGESYFSRVVCKALF